MKNSVRQLVLTVSTLTREIEGETGLLRTGALAGIGEAAARKQQAAFGYEEAYKMLAADAGFPAALPASDRQELLTAVRRLEAALKENTRTVAAMREASMRLIGRIIEAVNQNSPASGYTAAGRLAAEPGAVSGYRERV
jgi:hypothetical protein